MMYHYTLYTAWLRNSLFLIFWLVNPAEINFLQVFDLIMMASGHYRRNQHFGLMEFYSRLIWRRIRSKFKHYSLRIEFVSVIDKYV